MSEKRFRFDIPPLQLALFDLGGVLYHANFLLLLEQCREAFLRKVGIPYPQLTAEGSHLAVAELRQKFVKPVRYGDVVIAEMWAEGSPRRLGRPCVLATIGKLEGTLQIVQVAETRLVYVAASREELKPTPLPQSLRKAFNSILSSKE